MLIGQCRECYTRQGGAEGTVFCKKCLEVHHLEAERRKNRARRTIHVRAHCRPDRATKQTIMPSDENVTNQREMLLLAIVSAAQTAVETYRDLYPRVAYSAVYKSILDLERELSKLEATMSATAGR